MSVEIEELKEKGRKAFGSGDRLRLGITKSVLNSVGASKVSEAPEHSRGLLDAMFSYWINSDLGEAPSKGKVKNPDIGTLAELDLEPGDQVQCVEWWYGRKYEYSHSFTIQADGSAAREDYGYFEADAQSKFRKVTPTLS